MGRIAKKIIFFYQSPEISGGVDTVLINLIKAWPDKDDLLDLWLNKGHKGSFLYKDLGVKFRQINLLTPEDIKVIPGDVFGKVLRKLLKILFRLFKYPIFLYFIIFFYFKLSFCKPDVVFSHNGGYPGGELSLGLVIAAKLAGVKKVFLVVHNYAVMLKFPFGVLDKVLDKAIDASCTGIISVSAACAKQIQESRFPNSKKIDFIYNGINTQKPRSIPLAAKKKSLNIDDGSKVIGCIGDYEERKGHEYLIRAFDLIQDEFPYSKLVIIGSNGPEHTLFLQQLIKDLHLESKISLTGYLDAAWEYIECFDIFVFPSIAYESFGMVLLEAMLYKRPIIATNVGGIPEVLADTGIIVEPNDPQQISDAIKKILRDKDLANKLAEKGYERLINEFQAERMAQRYENYTSLENF